MKSEAIGKVFFTPGTETYSWLRQHRDSLQGPPRHICLACKVKRLGRSLLLLEGRGSNPGSIDTVSKDLYMHVNRTARSLQKVFNFLLRVELLFH